MAIAGTIERIYKVTVDGAEAIRQLQKIGESTASVDEKLSKFAETAVELGKKLGEAFAAKELVSHIFETIEGFDALAKEAQKVGLAAEDVQRLQFAAKMSGVEADALTGAIGHLATNLQHLGTASDDASKALKAMGVTSGDSPMQALEKIAAHFAAMPDGAGKAAEAIAIFGKKVGIELIPLLNNGAQGLREMLGEADKFGGVISGRVAEQASKFTDQVAKIERASAGAWALFTVGLIPAFTGVASAMTEAVSKGSNFEAWGKRTGTLLLWIAGLAVEIAGDFKKMGIEIQGMYRLVTDITHAKSIWAKWSSDIADVEDSTERLKRKMQRDAKQAAEDMGKPTVDAKKNVTDLAAILAQYEAEQQKAADRRTAAEAAARREAEASKEVYEQIVKLQKEMAHEADTPVNVQHETKAAVDATNTSLEVQAHATLALGGAINQVAEDSKEAAKTQEQEQLRWEALRYTYEHATGALKDYAQAQLIAGVTVKKGAEQSATVSEEMRALDSGFSRFVDNISQGSQSVAASFKAMARSIVADLLKIWAQRYILNVLFPGSSSTPAAPAVPHASGAAFLRGQRLAFASGGVVSGPTRFAFGGGIGLMGEAGPEAILPLQRGSDGALGVRTTVAPLKVAIHNYAGAQVSARRDSDGTLQVLIEQTKLAVASDIRRGGTDIARAAEGAWRLSRGSAAPF